MGGGRERGCETATRGFSEAEGRRPPSEGRQPSVPRRRPQAPWSNLHAIGVEGRPHLPAAARPPEKPGGTGQSARVVHMGPPTRPPTSTSSWLAALLALLQLGGGGRAPPAPAQTSEDSSPSQ